MSKIDATNKQIIKIGLFGIGLNTYWKQFEGLLNRLNSYQKEIENRLSKLNSKVINAGMVDDPFKANNAASLFNNNEVDMIVLFVSTYALSHNVLPVAQKTTAPILILNLQPVKAIDYKKFNSLKDRGIMTGEWLAHCQSCAVPEIASVFNRASIKYRLISGYLHEEYVWKEVGEWIEAIKVQLSMKKNRVGVLGHYYNGMLDVYTDLSLQAITFGTHFEIIEFGELKYLRETVSKEQIIKKMDEFKRVFNVSHDCSKKELIRAAKTSIALDKLVTNNKLGAIAYYYEGTNNPYYEDIATSLIPGFTLLTGYNVPVAGEYEIKNVQAMKIMDLLGCGGSFSEFYALDFNDDIIFLGHDGPAHFRIANSKIGLVPLPIYHGKPGKGLSIQMEVKNGPVTLFAVCQNEKGKLFFLVAEGESVEGETLQIGNTNSRYKFSLSARNFVSNWSMAGPSHHCAIGIGHKASVLKKIAYLYDVKFLKIC